MTKSKTLIIAGFPGVGKSYTTNLLKEKGLKVSDSDSSKFGWVEENGEKVRNPNFIDDYMKHIKEKVSEGYDYVFVSTQEDVLRALNSSDLEFIIVYPTIKSYFRYEKIYIENGDVFKDFILNNWIELILNIENYGKEDRRSRGKIVELVGSSTMSTLFDEDYISDIRRYPNQWWIIK